MWAGCSPGDPPKVGGCKYNFKKQGKQKMERQRKSNFKKYLLILREIQPAASL